MSKGKRRDRGSSRGAPRSVVDVSAAVATRQFGALIVNRAEQSITVDVSKLEAPARAYDADVAWVEHVPGGVSLIFAKIDRDDPGHFRSRLEVRYPPEDLLLTFWKNSRSFFTSLYVYVQQWPEEARRPAEPQTGLPALQSHSEWASFTYMSHSGSEAAIDFYHIAPGALARLARGHEVSGLKLLPVLRVQLSTFELMRLIERVQPLIDVIREYIPETHVTSKQVESSFARAEDEEEAASAAREYGS